MDLEEVECRLVGRQEERGVALVNFGKCGTDTALLLTCVASLE